jgi:glycosyltransferase involved in cell wall biosynthesis
VTRSRGWLGAPAWLVIREGLNQRWGSELRRRRIFTRLAERTGADIMESDWFPTLLRRAARGPYLGRLPGPLVYRLPQLGPKPRFAASEKLSEGMLDAAIAATDPAVVAVYDDPVAHARALGVTLAEESLDLLAERQRRNAAAFRWIVAPTRSFGELVGLDLDRLIAGGNGTDVRRITVGPWPSRPSIGIVSGAAPGRGLELLVAAVAEARSSVPDLALRMWLISTSEATEAYLRDLRTSVEGQPWVTIGTVSYAELGATLAGASVLCIPHPPSSYWDVALPVKLFDSLAAGRPLLITPRTETAAIVRGMGVGTVAGGDSVEDMAAAIVDLFRDDEALRSLGARAREVAEREFDWEIVGDRIATAVLEREAG